MDSSVRLKIIETLLSQPERNTLEKAIDGMKGKNIVIYGAGGYGKEMLVFFVKHDITVSAFLDRNADSIKSIGGVNVYTLQSYPYSRSDKIVVFSIVCAKSLRMKILDEIKAYGFDDVTEAQSLRCLTVDFSTDYDRTDAFGKICFVYERLCDEKSRGVFCENIKAHLTRDYSALGANEDEMSDQYFPADISPVKGYSRFIDCGGFIGDTVAEVMKRRSPERVVSFEPFIDNYKKLAAQCAVYADTKTEFTLFNNAVSDRISEVHFAVGTGSGTISENGELTIHTVSIDEALRGFRPTMIKMDIEGEELNALKGAAQTIKKSTPDMAVCVYHNIDHIWELPYYISSLDRNYRFFLRSYNSYTMETVLYAYAREVDEK